MRSLNTTNTNNTTSSHLTHNHKPPRATSPSLSALSSSGRSDLSVSRRAKLHEAPRRTPSSTPTTTTKTTTVRLNPRITAATTASTARRQQTLSPDTRPPLRNRDHNALSGQHRPPKPSSLVASRPRQPDMPSPHDYHHNKGVATGTPRQSLPNGSAAKFVARAPLTPKVAAASKTHHQQQPLVTPLVARTRKPDHATSTPGTQSTTTPSARDDMTSPVSAFLTSNNITPRSGHRQNRVDSANSTPTGTPNPERLTGDWNSPYDGDHVRRHVVTFSPPPDAGSRHESPDSKFFYASDARPVQMAQPKQPLHQAPPNKHPTFMYANGSIVDRSNSRPTSPGIAPQGFTPMLAPTQEAQPSKFFYANGVPDLQPSFRPTSSSGSAVSSNSKMTVSRTATSTPGSGFVLAHPSSPTKPPHLTLAPAPKGPTIAPQPLARAQTSTPQQFVPLAQAKRRVSLESPQPSTHSRNGSISSGDAMIMSKFMATQASHTSSEASSPAILPQNPAMTMASIIQAAEDFDDTQSIESEDHNELQSPTKSHAGDPLNDAVANARRERKVQDLEITNASLEAINRSLERQLRKQTAELRRYRRLSRSGRLSLASMSSTRIASDSTVGTAMTAEGLSDLSEEGEGDEEEEEEDDSLYETDPSESGSVTSPGLQAADRRRKRDEKRLQLDLSKHRELLVDSQKINQSIKRCLDWSEELIKEGRKALEYNVRVSDVELAPRVLAPRYDDEDDDTQDLSRLGTDAGDDPETAPGTPQTTNPGSLGLTVDGAADGAVPALTIPKGPRLAPPWAKDAQDRDSGVELPVDSG